MSALAEAARGCGFTLRGAANATRASSHGDHVAPKGAAAAAQLDDVSAIIGAAVVQQLQMDRSGIAETIRRARELLAQVRATG